MTANRATDPAVQIDEALVRRLLAAQFPHWAHLPVRAVDAQGWDNRTFRLGDEMAVRLPSARRYAAQVAKEQLWLPRLAPHLPLSIPEPLVSGEPGETYPWKWSVYRWLEGEAATAARIADLPAFAVALAGFLRALQRIDARDGPPAGKQSFYRGGALSTYDAETRQAIAVLGDRIDAGVVREIWERALAAAWRGAPVWFHGDVSAGNLLVKNDRLSAVIDFGLCGVGDPACDLVMAWTFFDAESRVAFQSALPLGADAWTRARGWALWKALIVLAGSPGTNPDAVPQSQRTLDTVVADHAAGSR